MANAIYPPYRQAILSAGAILAEHYQRGGQFRVWDAEAKREKWLNVDKAVCVEPVEVTRLHLKGER